MNSRLPHREFAGIQITTSAPEAVVAWIISRSQSMPRTPTDVHLLAGHSLSFLDQDPIFEDILQRASLVVPDGRWLQLLTSRSSEPLHQLRGADLLLQVCDFGRSSGLSHFFLGPDEKTGANLATYLEKRFPGIIIAGSQAFPWDSFDSESFAHFLEPIQNTGPNIVWLGISSPRQNIEAQLIARCLRTTTIAVGAAFDFVSGQKKTAPRWVQKIGFEWFFRFVSEPKRLSRRYVHGTIASAKRLLRHHSPWN